MFTVFFLAAETDFVLHGKQTLGLLHVHVDIKKGEMTSKLRS